MTAAALPMLGIDLGGTKIEAALLTSGGAVLWRHRVPTPTTDYNATLRAIAALVAQARAMAPEGLTVGIGTPGTARGDGLMKNCNSTCLNGQPLQRDIEAGIGQRITMANDANCLALSEATDGAGAGANVVFAAILGTGAGAGIAVHGRVLPGLHGLAGEWGHNTLPWAQWGHGTRDYPGSDPHFACYCGQRGCIESLVSGSGLAADHMHVNGEAISGEIIVHRAHAGDLACAATLQRHSHRLARALASIINLLDPDVIVLGGGLSRLVHLYDDVPKLWGQWVMGASGEPVRTRLLPAVHGDASGVRGAAWLGSEQGRPRH
jgi:fructokinase